MISQQDIILHHESKNQDRLTSEIGYLDYKTQNIPDQNKVYLKFINNQQVSENRQYTADQNLLNMGVSQKKSKYEILLILYDKKFKELQILRNENQTLEKEKNLQKSALEEELSQRIKQKINEQDIQRKRKQSQNSTTGEEDDNKQEAENVREQVKSALTPTNHDKSSQIQRLSRYLQQLRKTNTQASQSQINRIQQLKNQVSTISDKLSKKCRQQQQKSLLIRNEVQSQRLRLSGLLQQKQRLQKQDKQKRERLQQAKNMVECYTNKIEFLRQTSEQCDALLNEDMKTMKYRLQGRQKQYDQNKKYLDRLIKKRQLQQLMDFTSMVEEIASLNTQCQQMISKKDLMRQNMKKYKQKRLDITKQMQQNRLRVRQLDDRRRQWQQKIHAQKHTHDQFQDEYFKQVQKIEGYTGENFQAKSEQEKVVYLRQKKKSHLKMIESLVMESRQLKAEIESEKSLVPRGLLREYQKKIRVLRNDKKQVQKLLKQSSQIQVQNHKLNDQKQRLSWRKNPELQQLRTEQKAIVEDMRVLSERIKQSRREWETVQGRMQLMRQQIQRQKQRQTQQYKQKMKEQEQIQRKRLQKQQQIRLIERRQILMQRFRQKARGQMNQKQKKQTEKQREKQKQRSKKGKDYKQPKDSKNRQQKVDIKGRDFFVRRENPVQVLLLDFPLNRIEDPRGRVLGDPILAIVVLLLIIVNPALYFVFTLLNKYG